MNKYKLRKATFFWPSAAPKVKHWSSQTLQTHLILAYLKPEQESGSPSRRGKLEDQRSTQNCVKTHQKACMQQNKQHLKKIWYLMVTWQMIIATKKVQYTV